MDKKKVLIAEDNPVNQKLISVILRKTGHEFVIASTGEEAVDFCRNEKFDIILMDLHMPDMDGFDATFEIHKFNKEIPVVAITADVYDDIEQKCKEHGMAGYISKPYNKEDIAKVIDTFSLKNN